ncbi:hypothetical protein Mgra_00008151 [Meloidogyne graminicola]|uniref:EF-hand domain-containing protein n=1 Tax=Meloidogyne graminicola TaxID=189291 RepID=A0A8S9ZGQ1_9BILA|nr:hypothetical protein Mgra_00008151 [Meloidogyne graminicola]
MFIKKQCYIQILTFLIFYFVRIYGRPLNEGDEKLEYDEKKLTERVFKIIDLNNDNGITFLELMDSVEKGNKCLLSRDNRIEEEFISKDLNGDGVIKINETDKNDTFDGVNINKELFNLIDLNNDGIITKEEYILFNAHQIREEEEKLIKNSFSDADINKDGKLQLNEILIIDELNKKDNSKFHQIAAAITSAAMQFDSTVHKF